MTDPKIHFATSLQAIDATDWDALNVSRNPFLSYPFLVALEQSGSVTPDTGWQPHHLLISTPDQPLLAAIPSYIKQHSYGEYVFDWAWADAYHRYGQPYYPKLLSAIPFTPSVGPRLLTNQPQQLITIAPHIINAVTNLCEREGLSSWHLLFPDQPSLKALTSPALLQRAGCQFHWYNDHFDSFDHFLEQLTSRKRKSIRKERQQIQSQGISFRHLEGPHITETALDSFYLFYHATYIKRGQQGYLNKAFFRQLIDTMADNLLLVMAEKAGHYVAGALFLKGPQTLYGRYWGCLEEYKQLHFETCYYQGIEYCIEHQIMQFDAGAQGEHKIQRGFRPTPTYSLHWIKNTDFRAPIKQFVEQEAAQVEHYITEATSFLPFKNTI